MSPPFTISRLLKAPRQLVWEVLTRAEHLPNWLGPKGCTMPYSQLDFRVGGTFHYSMTMPNNGPTLWGLQTYKEISPPERIVLVQQFSDEHRGLGSHPMAPGWPRYTLATTTLTEQGQHTLFHLEWRAFEATPEEQALFDAGHASMTQGWSGNLDVLEQYLDLLQTKN